MNEKFRRGRVSGTSIVAFITLITAVLALIPAFMHLNNKHAKIFYSLKELRVSIPNTLDYTRVSDLLKSNGIPISTLEMKVVNQGNSSADTIKISISLSSEVVSVWTIPSAKEKPIWVDLPNINIEDGARDFRFSIKNLSTTKPVSINFGLNDRASFSHNSTVADAIEALKQKTSYADILVFYDGLPVTRVDNVEEIPMWSKWNVFKLPAFILGGGFLLMLLWFFSSMLYYDEVLRKRFIGDVVYFLRTNW